MLIQFSFRNYKSFKDDTVLDLSAANMTESSEQVVSVANDRILPVAAIYGANASGKSNLYSAFEYMSNYMIHSFKYGNESKRYKGLRPVPFIFSAKQKMLKRASRFTLRFLKMIAIALIFTDSALITMELQRNG